MMGRDTTRLITRWYSNIVDVSSFRGADCDTVHYLVIMEVQTETVSEQAVQSFVWRDVICRS
jgi:hypothetical protein